MPEEQGVVTITARDGKEGSSASVQYDFGANLEEAMEKFPHAVIYSRFIASAKVTAQSAIRGLIRAGKDEDEIQEEMSKWIPGVARRQADPEKQFARAAKLLASLTEEQVAALMGTVGQ